MSQIVSYRVAEVAPLRPTGHATADFPRRLLGRVLTAQDIVNLGGFFESRDRATVFHQGQTWVLTLENAETADEWNPLPHGRDEGAYDTDLQVAPRFRRQYIP